MKRIKWKNLGILVLVLGLIGYFIFAIIRFSHQDDGVVCQRVNIQVKDSAQMQFISKVDIRNLLNAHNIKLEGQLLSLIQTNEIEHLLEQNPAVKNVMCFKTTSNDISIQVWQRQPLFRVCGRSNYYVDVEGHVLPVSSNFALNVPVVTGSINKTFVTSKLKDFILFLRDDEFWDAQIQQVDVSVDSQIVLIPRVGDHEILMGDLEGYQQKLKKLRTFYEQGLNKIGWGNYKSISLKYKNQVVCTKK